MDEPDWTDTQVDLFARRIRDLYSAAWHAYVGHVREALIDSFVLTIVLGQLGKDHTVAVAEIRSLRARVGSRLATKYKMFLA